MKHRLPHYALAALLAVSSKPAAALEVGEMQVQSALNQLFDATIPLPTLAPEDLNGVSIKIASPAMFNEFGLERSAALAHLVFSIQYDAEGRVYVKAVSTQPIREPSLALLLEFSWPRGKTFREFTVLLDPVRRLAERPSSRSKTVLNTRETPEPAAMPSYKPGDFYGPILAGEGLWGIALKLRPEGITREQMMQALFQVNPQAFANNHVAGLKTGAKLRIPTYKEIADITGSPIAIQLAALEAGPPPPAAHNTPQDADTPTAFPLQPSIIPEPTVLAESTPSPAVATESKQPIKSTTSPAISPAIAVDSADSITPLLSIVTSAILMDAQQILATVLPAATVAKMPTLNTTSAIPTHKDDDTKIVAPATTEQNVGETSVALTPSVAPETAELLAAATTTMLEDAAQLLATITPTPAVAPTTPLASAASAETAPTAPAIAEVGSAKAEVRVIHPTQPTVTTYSLLPNLAQATLLDTTQLLGSITPSATFAKTPLVTNQDQPQIAHDGQQSAPQKTVTAPEKPEKPAKFPEVNAKDEGQISKRRKEYGPITNNERLWDIAGKVSPNPNLGKDVVMRALFLANPQAFSKPSMDSLKVGEMLRIPTLEEINKYATSQQAPSQSGIAQKNPHSSKAQNPPHLNKQGANH